MRTPHVFKGSMLINNLIDELHESKQLFENLLSGKEEIIDFGVDYIDMLKEDIDVDVDRYYEVQDDFNAVLGDLPVNTKTGLQADDFVCDNIVDALSKISEIIYALKNGAELEDKAEEMREILKPLPYVLDAYYVYSDSINALLEDLPVKVDVAEKVGRFSGEFSIDFSNFNEKRWEQMQNGEDIKMVLGVTCNGEWTPDYYVVMTSSSEGLKLQIKSDNEEIVYCYNGDMNAVGSAKAIALLWDEPILNVYGRIIDYKLSEGRKQLLQKASDGEDEYAFVIGLENLGITWWQHSAVVINIRELVAASEKTAKEYEKFFGNNGVTSFDTVFREEFVCTLCHEFRHAVYEFSEFVELDDTNGDYPSRGGKEVDVEEYGNDEAERLLSTKEAREYINAMFDVTPRLKEAER